MKWINRVLCIALFLMIQNKISAQQNALSNNYIGILPSVLAEPYDTINAGEVNTVPVVYEFRIGEQNSVGVQICPIVNYRFFKTRSGISQIGGTIVMNKYFLNIFKDDFWLMPQLGVFITYAYNRLDKIQTMTLGVEPGVRLKISKTLSISLNLQPGINYYPDPFSKDFVNTRTGFKSHFGFIFHIGYNF